MWCFVYVALSFTFTVSYSKKKKCLQICGGYSNKLRINLCRWNIELQLNIICVHSKIKEALKEHILDLDDLNILVENQTTWCPRGAWLDSGLVNGQAQCTSIWYENGSENFILIPNGCQGSSGGLCGPPTTCRPKPSLIHHQTGHPGRCCKRHCVLSVNLGLSSLRFLTSWQAGSHDHRKSDRLTFTHTHTWYKLWREHTSTGREWKNYLVFNHLAAIDFFDIRGNLWTCLIHFRQDDHLRNICSNRITQTHTETEKKTLLSKAYYGSPCSTHPRI